MLTHLYDLIKKSTQFWKFTDQLIEMTVKLTLKCPSFAVEMGNNRQFIRMIEQITKENPSFPITQAKSMIFKDGLKVDWNKLKKIPGAMQISQNNVENIKSYSKNRLERVDKIVNEATEQQEKGHVIQQ